MFFESKINIVLYTSILQTMCLKYFYFISLFLVLTSCDFLKEKLFMETEFISVDTIVDLSTVDVYPSFTACDSLIDSKRINACFEVQLHQYISKGLYAQKFTTTEDIEGTIQLQLLVNSYGQTELLQANIPYLIKKTLPNLDSVIRKSFENLPRMRPALKRGVPVSVLYNLPIVVQTN